MLMIFLPPESPREGYHPPNHLIVQSRGRKCEAAPDLLSYKYFQNAAPRWTRGMDDFPQRLCQEFPPCRQKITLSKDGDGYVLKSNVKNPFPTGYKPEIDITEELDQALASRYMQLIGILCWAVKIS
jgi:hypothetical protein